MVATEIVRIIKDRENVSFAKLGTKLGISPVTLYNRLRNTENLGTKQFVEILDALGYKVAIIKNGIAADESALILDNNVKFGFQVNNCVHCGHSLTKREKQYKACPYCLELYGEEKLLWQTEESYYKEMEEYRQMVKEAEMLTNDSKEAESLVKDTVKQEEAKEKKPIEVDIDELLKI